jgi:hypothetical protein
MPTNIDGATGISAVQNGAVQQPDLAANVAGNGPAFAVRMSGTQSFGAGVYTKLQWNVEDFDTANAFDSTTNYRFNPQVAGYYQFSFVVECNATGTTLTAAFGRLYKNGAGIGAGSGPFNSALNAAQFISTGSQLVFMNGTTDYIECWSFISGTSPVVNTGNSSVFNGHLARAA